LSTDDKEKNLYPDLVPTARDLESKEVTIINCYSTQIHFLWSTGLLDD